MTNSMRRHITSTLATVATIVGLATAVAATTGAPVVSARPGVVPLRCVDPTKDCTHLGPASGVAVPDCTARSGYARNDLHDVCESTHRRGPSSR